ncbi:MAG: hypothetical protein L0Y60_11785 [Beijerinckiaceae bacterium]|nr:hypothetical protein [Beijerinckiaceae bacterium]
MTSTIKEAALKMEPVSRALLARGVMAVFAVMLTPPAITFAAPVNFSASGKTPADIKAKVESFRNFLGANNGIGGTFQGGRREINWDGVPDAVAAPNNMPANFFNANSPRGAVFFTPGSGFQISANAGVAPIEFDNLHPNLSRIFSVFSPQRLFTGLNSTVVETLFFVPGTHRPATTKGFGAVFTDVDRGESTKIEYFDVNGALLATVAAPPAKGNETLSFIGAGFNAGEQVYLVRITSGNVELGDKRENGFSELGNSQAGGNPEFANSHAGGPDLVVMDDFIYGEPKALQ